jgi:hypothetical protein
MLDVTAGVIDLQRVWDDSSHFEPEMASRMGLRWYKNRSVFGYYLYDFWNDEFLGEISGNSIISRPLKPQQSLVYALRRKFDRPQVISTNRHIMQGLLDPATWNPVTLTLSGTTRVVAGEPAVITLAGNGYQPVTPERADISITRDGDLVKLTLTSDTTTDVAWSLVWKK